MTRRDIRATPVHRTRSLPHATLRLSSRYGEHSRDWFYAEGEKEPSKAKVAWKGENEFSTSVKSKIRVYLMSWDNPKLEKINSIDFNSRKEETVAAPFCEAITAEVK
jgi:hypothetical protein